MKNMKKKVFSILAGVTLVGGLLAGCSGDKGADGELPKKVTIGAVVPMTGTGASYGVMDMNGANLAIKEINENGGVKGIKLAIKYEDHQAKPGVAVTAINRLIDVEKAPYIISNYSSISLAAAPIGDQRKVVVMNAGGQSDNLAGAGEYFYNNIPLVGAEVEVIAKYLVEKEGLKTAGVLYANDDGGRSSLAIFEKAFKEAGGKVLAKEATELGGSDFRAQISKVKSKNPDVMFVGTYGQDTALIIKQAHELGVKSVISNTSWSIIPEVYAEKGAEGMIHTALHFEASKEFTERYKKEYGVEPPLYAVTHYDAVMIFAKALEKVVDDGKAINGENIKKAIDEINEFDGVAGKVKFDAKHTTTLPIDISVLKDGKAKVIETVGKD